MVVHASLGAHLKFARDALGFSQEEVADKVGVDRTTVGRWERDLARPRGAALRRLIRLGLIDRHSLKVFLADGGQRSSETIISIIAPRELLIGGCKFGVLHIRNGTTQSERAINAAFHFQPVGDHGELRATVPMTLPTGFEFKCFVDFGGQTFEAVQKALERAGFAEVTIGEGKLYRAWFLLPNYRVVVERRTDIKNNLYFPE